MVAIHPPGEYPTDRGLQVPERHGGPLSAAIVTWRLASMTRFAIFCRTLGLGFLILIGGAQRVSALTVNTLVDEQDGGIYDGDVSLRDALNRAYPGELITFSVTGTIKLTLGELKVTKQVRIDGPGRTLLIIEARDPTPTLKNGDGSRAFSITDSNAATSAAVSIRGVTIRGGDVAGDGGGILSQEELSIENCEVSNCYSSGSGGAIHSSGSFLLVTSSAMFNNAAKFGGGGAFVAAGGARFDNLYARANTAENGGAIYGRANVPIYLFRGTLQENRAKFRGGGVRSNGPLDVERTYFYTNRVGGNSTGFDDVRGGAIYTLESTAVRISGAVFSGNSAISRSGFGGAICSEKCDPDVIGCQFTNCSSGRSGGAIYSINPNCRLTNCDFTGCTSSEGGAIYSIWQSGVVRVNGGTFTNNTGTAIYLVLGGSQALVVEGVTEFVGNSGGAGGAIRGPMTVTGATFRNNLATGSGSSFGALGGAVLVNATSTFTDCVFIGNVSREGGAAGVAQGTATFTRTTFTTNRATNSGGGLFIAGNSRAKMIASSVTGNVSDQRTGGDAFVSSGGALEIDSASTVQYIAGPGTVIRN